MSLRKVSADQFKQLFLNNTPFLDVRAPIEFEKGSLPTASNIPILNTQEREQVGLCYKQKGQDAAIELGYKLVSGEVKSQRIDAWSRFVKDNPHAHLYCWRGGMRSNLTQQALSDAGFDVPLITGGFKALRRLLIDEVDLAAKQTPLIIIGGKTGTAKTTLIKALSTGVDLEGLAHHRGSSFGRRAKQPPCQVDFENYLGIDILKKRYVDSRTPLFLEDESRNIGPVTIPLNFWRAMLDSRRVIVERPIGIRIQHILQEYVIDMVREHLAADKNNGFEHYRQYLLASVGRIKNRLGGQRYTDLRSQMVAAIDQQERSNTVDGFIPCIKQLLEQYYDPMYTYQMERKQSQVIFRGSYEQVLEWATDYNAVPA